MAVRHVAWLVLLVARLARAEPTVVLVETRAAPALPGLVSQIELHAGRRVAVQALAARDADPMTFGDPAAQLVASGRATIVVWIAPVDRAFLVFAAGGWPGRALVELVRVDAALGAAELERTVALKIAGLLDAMLAPRAGARAALGIPAAVQPAAWRIEVAGLVAREAHQRGLDGRVTLAASRTWALGPWGIAPLVAGYWQPTGAIDGVRGQASVTELGAAIALEASRGAGRTELFARPRFVAAAVAARGVANDGRRGAATVFAPYTGLEAGARLGVSDTLQLGLVTGAEVALIHHELLIDREAIVDLGRLRLHVGVALTMSL
jgi:hypothetical protein